jgi:hypothetical protein
MKAAGVLRDDEKARRLILDLELGKPAKVYVERVGDTRLMDLVPPMVT